MQSWPRTALAIPLIFQPHKAADFLLGSTALPHNVEHEHLFGLLAAGLLSGAAASWALKVRGRGRGWGGRECGPGRQ